MGSQSITLNKFQRTPELPGKDSIHSPLKPFVKNFVEVFRRNFEAHSLRWSSMNGRPNTVRFAFRIKSIFRLFNRPQPFGYRSAFGDELKNRSTGQCCFRTRDQAVFSIYFRFRNGAFKNHQKAAFFQISKRWTVPIASLESSSFFENLSIKTCVKISRK